MKVHNKVGSRRSDGRSPTSTSGSPLAVASLATCILLVRNRFDSSSGLRCVELIDLPPNWRINGVLMRPSMRRMLPYIWKDMCVHGYF